MAQRELDIIAKARVTLNDISDSPRWSTERLMNLLSEGQDLLTLNNPLLVHTQVVNTDIAITYVLPEDCVQLLSATVKGVALPLTSYEDIEKIDLEWGARTGSLITAILLDTMDHREMRPYPIVAASQIINLRYHARAATLGWDDTLEDCITPLSITTAWDEALKQYIISGAFIDYGDASSLSRAQVAQGLFKDYIAIALKLASNTFTPLVNMTTDYSNTREMGIINSARVTLNDIKVNPIYTTQRLMRILNDAQQTMCKAVPLLTENKIFNLVGGMKTYRLPDNSVKLLTANYDEVAIPIMSYEDIESIDRGWSNNVGSSVTSVLVDALNQQEIRPYPLTSGNHPLNVKYQALPIDLGWDETVNSNIETLRIASMWDEAMTNYIIFKALIDYGDADSAVRADTIRREFELALVKAMKLSKKSFAKRVLTTKYQASVKSNNRGDRYGSGNCRFGY